MPSGEIDKVAALAIKAGVPFWEFSIMAKRAYIREGLKHHPNVCAFAKASGVHRNTLVRWGAHKRNWTRSTK